MEKSKPPRWINEPLKGTVVGQSPLTEEDRQAAKRLREFAESRKKNK